MSIKGYLSANEFIALKQRKFELHCLQMKLEQITPDGQVFSGSGIIKQTPDGQLQFTLYSRDVLPLDKIMNEITSINDIPIGQIMPDHVFFRLSATDLNGREWISNYISPNKHTFQNGSLCTGELTEIIHEIAPPTPIKSDHLYLEIYDDIDIPCNTRSRTTKTVAGQESSSGSLNVLKFDAGGYEFSFQKEEGSLQIRSLAKDVEFNDHFEIRISEALQFVVARPIFWSAMEQRTSRSWKICIRSSRSSDLLSRIRPPLPVSHDNTQEFCRMFENYFLYVLAAHTGENLHPLSAQMRAICHASMGAVEAEALTLSVAIESILKYVHASKYEISQEEKDWIEKAKIYFASWGGSDSLRERIYGLFSMLYTPSASMRLGELVDLQAITKQQKQAWGNLRHKLAHGASLGSASLQEFLDLSRTVLVLFYHLIFYAIDYRGKYTDYSLPGWPTREYSSPMRNVSSSIQATQQWHAADGAGRLP